MMKKICRECGKMKEVGKETGECLECLDWKVEELRR
jgi:hypothetical protein